MYTQRNAKTKTRQAIKSNFTSHRVSVCDDGPDGVLKVFSMSHVQWVGRSHLGPAPFLFSSPFSARLCRKRRICHHARFRFCWCCEKEEDALSLAASHLGSLLIPGRQSSEQPLPGHLNPILTALCGDGGEGERDLGRRSWKSSPKTITVLTSQRKKQALSAQYARGLNFSPCLQDFPEFSQVLLLIRWAPGPLQPQLQRESGPLSLPTPNHSKVTQRTRGRRGGAPSASDLTL